jgi:hypothetical protein
VSKPVIEEKSAIEAKLRFVEGITGYRSTNKPEFDSGIPAGLELKL